MVVVTEGVALVVAEEVRVLAAEAEDDLEAVIVDVAVFDEVVVVDAEDVELAVNVPLADAVKDAEPVAVDEELLDFVEEDDPVIVGVIVPEREGDPELVDDLLEDFVLSAVGVAEMLADFVEEPDGVRVAS